MLRRLVAVTPEVGCPATVCQAARRSIYEYKFGQTPLTQPFGAINSSRMPSGPKTTPPAPKASKVEVTKLHNGVRVISQNLGGASVSVGAYILAGPAYDPANCPGVGAMMHLALTTSNYNNSLFQLDRNIRSIGAAQSHFEMYKHYLGIRIDVREDRWKSAASTAPRSQRRQGVQQRQAEEPFNLNVVQDNIFTCIAAPRFHESDIERYRDTIDNQVKELRWQCPADYARQMIETVAFYREPLGSPRLVPEVNNSNITSQVLLDQYSRYVVPSRIVIAGVNVDHAALIAEYENTPFPHSASAPHHMKVQAASAKQRVVSTNNEAGQYTGGERHDHEDRPKAMGTKPDMNTEAVCAVGWLAYGRDKKMVKDYAASMVVKALIDTEFNDAMRHNKDELHQRGGIRSFYNPYQTAGLLGITVTADPQSAVRIVTDAVKAVQSKKTSISSAALTVAKNMARTQYLVQNVDTIRDYCDFLGTSLAPESDSTVGTSIEEVVDAINSVGEADVKKVLDTMLSHHTSLYAHGEVLGFPSLRQMGL